MVDGLVMHSEGARARSLIRPGPVGGCLLLEAEAKPPVEDLVLGGQSLPDLSISAPSGFSGRSRHSGLTKRTGPARPRPLRTGREDESRRPGNSRAAAGQSTDSASLRLP